TDALGTLALSIDKLATSPRQRLQVYLTLGKALRGDPRRRDTRRRLVDVAIELGRFADAEEHLRALDQWSPGDAEIEQLLGETLEAQGKYVEAADYLAQAVEHEPNRMDAYVRL